MMRNGVRTWKRLQLQVRRVACAAALFAVVPATAGCGTYEGTRWIYFEGRIDGIVGTAESITVTYPSRLDGTMADSEMARVSVPISASGEYAVGLGRMQKELWILLPPLSPTRPFRGELSPIGVRFELKDAEGASVHQVTPLVVAEVEGRCVVVRSSDSGSVMEGAVRGACELLSSGYSSTRYHCDLDFEGVRDPSVVPASPAAAKH